MVSWAVRLSVKPGSRLKFWDVKYHLYILGKKSFASSTSSHLTHSLPTEYQYECNRVPHYTYPL